MSNHNQQPQNEKDTIQPIEEPLHTTAENQKTELLNDEIPSEDIPEILQTGAEEADSDVSASDTFTSDASVSEHDLDTEDAMGKTSKKIPFGGKVALIVGIVILALLLIGGGIVLSVFNRLRGEDVVPIVDRDSAYSMHEPEDTIITISLEDYATMTEEPEQTDAPPVTEKVPAKDPAKDTAKVTEKTPPKKDPKPIYRQPKKDENVTNILLLGRDSRNADWENGRTDSMIILSYNQKTHEVKLISLMRDMLIPIEGHDYNRINTAFAFGGIGLCINTLNDVFQLDIQDYMTIDFTGIKKVIDAIGGIDVTLTESEVALYQEQEVLDSSVKAGVVHLNGSKALHHARNRALGADFERTRRQRDILMAIYQKVTSSMSLNDVTALVTTALDCVTTNLSTTTILSLATDVMNHKNDITFNNARLPFDGTYVGGWYKKMLVIQFDLEKNIEKLHALLYGEGNS